MDKQEQKGRDSIWSVSRETKGLYFIVFITLALIGGGLVTYTEVHVNKADGIVDTALAAWAGVGRLVIASVAGSLIVTEVMEERDGTGRETGRVVRPRGVRSR